MVSKDGKTGSSTSTKGDDFLAQVLATEEQAEQVIEKAYQKKEKDTEKLKSTLKAKREEALQKAKEKAKEDLEKATISARANYEQMVKAAQKEADDLLSSKEGVVSGLMNDAQDFFLQKL